jgi:cysteine desulfurase family protein (TIGR01976 family)
VPNDSTTLLDIEFARSCFPALAPERDTDVFLDNAGGSQVLGAVADRVRDYLLTSSVQLGATYRTAQLAADRMRHASASMAEFINAARPEEVVFGPCSTVLLQWLARASASMLADGDEIIVSRVDHEANISPWLTLRERGVLLRFWEMNPESHTLEVTDLERLLSPRTRLVVCTQTTNIFGRILPIADFARAAHRGGAAICVDGVAFAPHRAIDVRAWDVDFYVFSLYKVFGPHHAVMYGKYDRLLELDGLSHHFIPKDRIPGKLQPGNPNYELSYGSSAIPEYLADLGARSGADGLVSRRQRIVRAFDAIATHEEQLGERVLTYLRSRKDIRIIGPASADRHVRVPTFSFVIEGRTGEEVTRHMDALGVGIRFGDFYARRLIEDLGLAPGGVIRASFAHYNTMEDADRLIEGLDRL